MCTHRPSLDADPWCPLSADALFSSSTLLYRTQSFGCYTMFTNVACFDVCSAFYSNTIKIERLRFGFASY